MNYGETTATALVTIAVQDVNDNKPEFSRDSYTAEIQENMQQGVPIDFGLESMRVNDPDQVNDDLSFGKNL